MGIPNISLLMDFGFMAEAKVLASMRAFAEEVVPRVAATLGEGGRSNEI